MVPVNTRLAMPEIRYILEDSGAQVLFVDGAMQAHAAALAGQTSTVEAMFYLDDDAPPAGTRPYEELAADRQSQMRAPVVTPWPACSTPAAPRGSPRA